MVPPQCGRRARAMPRKNAMRNGLNTGRRTHGRQKLPGMKRCPGRDEPVRKRLARRAPLGISRVGGFGANTSGDIFIAFSTANSGAAQRQEKRYLEMLPNDLLDSLLKATVQATEEAILNALIAAETMRGRNGNLVYALPHERLQMVLKQYNRL